MMSAHKEILSGPSNLIVVQSRALLFNSKNEILLVSNEGDRWSTPGGTVDKYESLNDLVINEIYEETGLRASMKNLAYFTQEKWRVHNGFWYFNEHLNGSFMAMCFVFCYHCQIEGSEDLDPNWEDLGHGIVKHRRFFSEDEFLKLGESKKLSQAELIGIKFDDMKKLNNFDFGFRDYDR